MDILDKTFHKTDKIHKESISKKRVNEAVLVKLEDRIKDLESQIEEYAKELEDSISMKHYQTKVDVCFDLSRQLKEAHEVIKFYGNNDPEDECNGYWTTLINFPEQRTRIVHDGERVGNLVLGGKKAREYMSKWGVE